MELEEAERLVEEFLRRAARPPQGPPRRVMWFTRRPISDEDLTALDELMGRLLGLEEFDVRRLCRRLGLEVYSHRHPSLRNVQHRWSLFEHLKSEIIRLRGERDGLPEGAEEAGEVAAGA